MTNRFETTGTLKAKMDTQQINDRFRKREFALEIADGNYPQMVKFQLVQDKCELLDQFNVGDEMKVHFNLKGREFTRRDTGATDYFTNVEAWRLEAAGKGAGAGDGMNQDFGPGPDDYDQRTSSSDDPPF